LTGVKAVTTLNKMLTAVQDQPAPPASPGAPDPTPLPATSPPPALASPSGRTGRRPPPPPKPSGPETPGKKLADSMRGIFTLNGSGPVDIYSLLWDYLAKIIPRRDAMVGSQITNEFWYTNSMISELLCKLGCYSDEIPRYDVYVCMSSSLASFCLLRSPCSSLSSLSSHSL
jgi:hypothetical protein